jgi:hypothetical protein
MADQFVFGCEKGVTGYIQEQGIRPLDNHSAVLEHEYPLAVNW